MLNYISVKIYFPPLAITFFYFSGNKWDSAIKKMFILRSYPFSEPFFYFIICFEVLGQHGQQGHAASIEISNNPKEHSLVNTRQVVKLPTEIIALKYL